MKDLMYAGEKIKLVRGSYSCNNALYVGALYYDQDCDAWLPYGDVSVNLEVISDLGDHPNCFAVKDYESFGQSVVDMIKTDYNVVFLSKVQQGYGTFSVYMICDMDKFKADVDIAGH